MSIAVAGAAALLVFALASTTQALTGFGFALVAVPLLALVLDPVTAVVATTIVGLFLTSFASYRERRYVDRPVAARITVAGMIGLPVGLLALTRLDESSLTILIAGGLLVLVVLLWLRVRLPSGPGAQYASGLLSGMMLTSTGMNGPPLVLTLQGQALPPRRFRGTLQAVFWIQDLVAVAAFVFLSRFEPLMAMVVLSGVAGVPAGWWFGDRLFARIPPTRFRSLVLTALTVTALVSLVTAVS